MSIQILPATSEADFAALKRLLDDMKAWDLAMTRAASDVDPSAIAAMYEDSHADYRQIYLAPGSGMFLGFDGEMVVGCLGFVPFKGQSAEISKFWVSPAARGKGLGQALLAHVLGFLPGAGYTHACLETASFMTSAIALYESAGFRRCIPFRTPVEGLEEMDVFMDRPL